MTTQPPRDGARLEQAMHQLQTAVDASTAANRDLAQTVKDLKGEISQTYVRKDVLEPTLEAIRDDIKAHGDWITWATRIVLALVIAAVVGAVLVQGGR